MHSNLTIGVAGHIDHGKTALTKALTNIDTDRLPEEKKRKISIENGYAFLDLGGGYRAAVIDVPGHERFIKKMIAGVAGIDLTLLIIAADEGVMPQTREHLDILQLLGIPNVMIVITKMGLVDQEFLQLVKGEIKQTLDETAFENAPFYFVDSITGFGIEELRNAIIAFSKTLKKQSEYGPLRLPIDDIFTIHGHGTVVRGTIFNGSLSMETKLRLLPQDKHIRIKQLQVHHEKMEHAWAGQRVAVNISGVDYKKIKRGDVLVDSDFYKPTRRLDVVLYGLKSVNKTLKQRSPVTFHSGASTVQGRITFFDRNHWEPGESIYAQIELEDPVVLIKGDRFVLRRPTPVETLGGGEVLNPTAVKHPFGQQTVLELDQLVKGTPAEWVTTALSKDGILTRKQLENTVNIKKEELDKTFKSLMNKNVIQHIPPDIYILSSKMKQVAAILVNALRVYHEKFPLREGMGHAEWLQSIETPKALTDVVIRSLTDSNQVIVKNHIVYLSDFKSHYPPQWEKRLKQIEEKLLSDGLTPGAWTKMLAGSQIPDSILVDFQHFLINTGKVLIIGEDRLIHANPFNKAVLKLRETTGREFSVPEAKEVLGLSRKHIIPFLELCDKRQLTIRKDNKRLWIEQ